jgi:hypothetical protein
MLFRHACAAFAAQRTRRLGSWNQTLAAARLAELMFGWQV